MHRSDLLSEAGFSRAGDTRISWSRYLRSLVREEIVVLIFLRFVGEQLWYVGSVADLVRFGTDPDPTSPHIPDWMDPT
jgi:hypothetical protein